MSGNLTERLEPISGNAEQVRVILTGLTVRHTTKGPRYPYGNFGSDFLEALHKRLIGPKHRGLLRSTLLCPSCERSLTDVVVLQVLVGADVELSKVPLIHVDVEMPGWVCPGCSRRLVMIHDRNIQSDLTDALVDAFNRAGLAP